MSCQKDITSSPDSIAREYYKASYKMDWRKTTELMHPKSLSKFRKDILTLVGLADSSFKTDNTFDSLSAIKSYQVDSLFKFIRNKNTSTLNDSDFFYSFCKIVYPYIPPSQNYQPDTIINIGYIMEGSDTAHVLTRINITKRKTKLSGILMLSLGKYKNTWKVLLPDELENKLKMQLAIRQSRYFNN